MKLLAAFVFLLVSCVAEAQSSRIDLQVTGEHVLVNGCPIHEPPAGGKLPGRWLKRATIH